MKKIKLVQEKVTKKYVLLDEAIEQFYKSCIVKNLTPSSIKYYKEIIGYFLKFSKKDYLQQYTNEDMVDYIVHMKEKGLKDTTINIRLRGIKVFFNFCYEQEYIDKPFKINTIKETEVIKQPYTEEELERLLVKPNMNQFHEYRNWVIINFLLATGCRASTLLNIKKKHINFDNDTIIFEHTKNRKSQIIPIAKSLRPILLEYFELLEDDIEENDYAFPSQWGTKMELISLQAGIRRYNRSRGVEKTSVHLFRHTFGSNCAKNGMNAFKIQALLGHTTLKMTNIYIHMQAENLKEDIDNSCILNKYNKK